MKQYLVIVSVMLSLFSSASVISAENRTTTLSPEQQAIIPISAFTAVGDLERLKPSIVEGLEKGLTISEIKEIMVHLYAYAGFPRTLNGLATFRAVLQERKAEGIEDDQGREASPVPDDFDKDSYGAKVRAKLAGLEKDISGAEWQLFSPISDTFLKEHLFGDIFVRDNLTHQQRELVTIAALGTMSGTAGQLRFHLGAAMNTGLSAQQLKEFADIMTEDVGIGESKNAGDILTRVLESRK